MELAKEILSQANEEYIVVTGCKFSGLQSIAYALNGVGKDVGYEYTAGNDGIASDFIASWDFGDATVFHFVRHPLAQISLMSEMSDWEGFWVRGDTILSRCMLYWTSWNTLIAPKADYTICIEDIEREWSVIVAEAGLPATPMPLVLGDLEYGSTVSWDDLEQDDRELCDEVRELAVSYGYEVGNG